MATAAKKKNPHYQILMISSEMVPYAKTGGLADVVGSLPLELARLGHDVRVVIPKYASIDNAKFGLAVALSSMGVWMGGTLEWCSVFEAKAGDGKVTVYFVEHHAFFGREGLYHDAAMNDYRDNPRRFGFLSRAGLQLCLDIGFAPDIVHVHDWQSAAAAAYLKTWHWNDPLLGKAASVLTIHNAAYQGIYPKADYGYLGLGEQNFHADAFETFGSVNLLKGGIFFADLVNTVSPGYAREIAAPHGGFGLAPYLTNKGTNFFGILNGVDYGDWSPDVDKKIPANYSAADISGKKICKAELQKRFGLAVNPEIPLFAAIGRFVDQKGYALLAPAIERALAEMSIQFAILGSGDPGLQTFFGEMPARFPGRAGSWIGYDVGLSHLIEAGADFFLMPSLYEPCGLNQLYSLRYGTLPIVRATGGLDDTVENYDEKSGDGTGFKFWDISVDALYYTIGWANSTWYDRPAHVAKMRDKAMRQDFSWDISTAAYLKAYARAIENKKEYDRWPR